jgi:hypothetical protein
MNEGPLGYCNHATPLWNECEALCTPRDPKESTQGYCAQIPTRKGDWTCRSYCKDKAPSWTASDRAKFAQCMANDPLCYRTLDDCMR